MAHAPEPLKHLAVGWFAIVMGLAGLALAWLRAVPLLGEMAAGVALVVALAAAAVFVALALASIVRAWRHPQAWAEDRRHPVRHPFVAAIPIGALLLATCAVALGGHDATAGPLRAAADALWRLASIAQFVATVWVLQRWLRPATAAGGGGLPWAGVTPALFIPIVGNVLVPLAGVPLGHVEWSAAQFGIGVLFWPVVLALLVVRLAVQGLWAERLRAAGFILVAPPAVIGLALLQFGASTTWAWAMWGIAAFSFAWATALLPALRTQPFALPHWALSFPLAAFAALSLRLAPAGSPFVLLALGLLALASLVILALAMATVRGLRDGTLLQPEVAAPIAVAGAPAAPPAPG